MVVATVIEHLNLPDKLHPDAMVLKFLALQVDLNLCGEDGRGIGGVVR